MSRGFILSRTCAAAFAVFIVAGPAFADVEVNRDVLDSLGRPATVTGSAPVGGSPYGQSVSKSALPFNRTDNQDRFSVPSVLPARPYAGSRSGGGGIKLRKPGAPRPAAGAATAPVTRPEPVSDAADTPAVSAAPVAPVRREPVAPAAPASSRDGGATDALTAPAVVEERRVTAPKVAPEPPRQVTTEPPRTIAAAPEPEPQPPVTAPTVDSDRQTSAAAPISPELARIVFEETSSELPDGSQDVISAFASNITDSASGRVQIHSYAFAENETLLWARRMAQRRAIIVRKVLRDSGITANRIAVRTDIDPDDNGPRNRVDLTVLPPR